MHWANAFVGIPHVRGGRSQDGADCWGIGVLAYRARANIDLKTFEDVDCEDHTAVLDAAARERSSGLWLPVAGVLRDLDLVQMWSRVRVGEGFRRLNVHVGFVVAPDRVLHSEAEIDCVCVPLKDLAPRVAGIWRHRDLA